MTDAVTGVTDVVEAAHATVARPFGRPRRTRGLTGWIYRLVRGTTRGVGHVVDRVLDRPPWADTPGTPTREALVAALNGAFGDHVAASGNPLATPMHLRHAGRPLDLDRIAEAVAAPSDTLLVAIHGICMHDAQWGSAAHDPIATLAGGIGATAVAIRYNSGRPIAQNGRDAADLLDALATAWPVSVRRVVVVGHSMGGLVGRYAFAAGAAAGQTWTTLQPTLVTLGSPHHGAPLERLGHGADRLLGATRWSAPYARLGESRSVGVTDLRYGIDDSARALPPGVAWYAVAATVGAHPSRLREQSVGDGLVPLDSALGRHRDPTRRLAAPPDGTWIARGMHHFDLLRRPEVTAHVLDWLTADAA